MVKKQQKGYLKRFRNEGTEYYEIKIPSRKKVLDFIFLSSLIIGGAYVALILFVTPVLTITSFALLYEQQTGDPSFTKLVSKIIVKWVISVVLLMIGIIGYKLNNRKKK